MGWKWVGSVGGVGWKRVQVEGRGGVAELAAGVRRGGKREWTPAPLPDLVSKGVADGSLDAALHGGALAGAAAAGALRR